jgi:PAS domain S-box-containing protein
MFDNTGSVDHYPGAGGELRPLSHGALDVLFNTLGFGIWRWNFSTNELFLDTKCALITGYGGDEKSSGEIKKNLIYFRDLPLVRKGIESYLAGKNPWYEAEFRMIRKNGTLIWIREKGVITEWDKSGTPVLMTGLLREITPEYGCEKEIRREKLFKENERLRTNTEILRKETEEAKGMSAALFNADPHVHLLFNHSLRLIDCSAVAVEYFGFSSKENFLAQFRQFIRTITLVSTESTETLGYFREWLIYTARYGYCTFDIQVSFQGRIIPLRVICKRLAFAGHSLISMYLNDLSTFKNTKNMLVRQERQLKTIYAVIYLLLSACQEDFPMILYEALKYLGQGVKADRAYIWQNFLMDGRLQSTKVSEWHTPRFLEGKDRMIRFFYDDYFPHWHERMLEGLSLNKLTKDLESPLTPFYSSGSALAILVVPIIFRDRFWGFIGLENCTDERLFTRREEVLIRTGGALMAAAIDQREWTVRADG